MSKAFADVAEIDMLKFAVLWHDDSPRLVRRILLCNGNEDIQSLCFRRGASSLASSSASRKALGSLKAILAGGDGSELEALLALEELKPFSLKALQILREAVPRGKATSYGRLAELCGKPGAARAVGGAMGANPFPLFFPCHRVVAANFSLGGFGFGLALKARLLELEGVTVDSLRDCCI